MAYQRVVREAWHEIDTAVTSYTAERQRQVQMAERVRHSEDVLALSAARYRHGLTDFCRSSTPSGRCCGRRAMPRIT